MLSIVRQDRSLGAEADLDFALEMLAAARQEKLGPTVRLYRPQPTLAFGQRDTKLPGFPAAEIAARNAGFEPLVRRAGGRAAAYHQGCLVVDHVEPSPDAIAGARRRFAQFGELLANSLVATGVVAGVGEIPGEYCPGEFSVHGVDPIFPQHRLKLVGTAQRVVSGGWLFSSVIVVERSQPIRRVLEDVYSELGLDWDPTTAGSVDDLVPHVGVDDIEEAVIAAYAATTELSFKSFDWLEGIHRQTD
ncbi:lipoyl protein ligase domain-containing protein [Pseudarthrobacter sp. J1763]|uniref:lipoyl protein ligase domain-containing protein n=1 Tax=Pseudarthrobacter sp. J1763 TaxID=3420445 RepID=UPI003D2A3FD0